MQPFIDTSNNQRAAYLHQWFPDEIPALLDDIFDRAQHLEKNSANAEKEWVRENHLFDFSYWLSTAKEAKRRIQVSKPKLIKNHNLFAEQLFNMPLVFFTADGLVRFAQSGKASRKFKEAALLFFA